ncbi:hypothetical protein PUW25_26420 (plasmid) [Paenibacillus urinalis]|uniref:RCC1-like domain-containing protein n=1 Tax=Paenibacillus urinalis TaxID=521520 RepID=A0ABY7XH64_9BACL|nr:hypothetical protein [Paenibacillus urinalis]WDI05108.1 hypothetical protein PUW25_26420 [Paenibacillus urinalis]
MATGRFSFFIMEDGSVMAAGLNSSGQLGTGGTGSVNSTPIKIGISNVKQVSFSDASTMFLLNDGTVKATGLNGNGQLGIGNTANQLSPVDVQISDVKQVSCGSYHTVFLMQDGTVKTVGINGNGQLGIGNTQNKTIPTDVAISNVKQVSCGATHTMFLMEDGTVKATGYNRYGELGVGNTLNQSNSPIDVPISGVKKIACYNNRTVFLLENGDVKGCGYNSNGQLGVGGGTQFFLVDIPVSGAKDIVCGFYHTMFLMEDGTAKTCGYNSNGQMSIGDTGSSYTTPVSIELSGIKQISCGDIHTAFLMEDGTVRTTGFNNNGQLGSGNTTSKIRAAEIPLSGVKSLWEQIIEIKTKFLIAEDNQIKGYSPDLGWFVVGESPATEELFLDKGIDSISDISSVLWNELKDNFSILQYSSEETREEKIIFEAEPFTPFDQLRGEAKLLMWTDDTSAKRTVSIEAVPHGKLIMPAGDMLIPTEGLNSISLNAVGIKAIASVDQGQTWKAWDGSNWITVAADLPGVKTSGMTSESFNSLTGDQWNMLIQSSNTIRFAYYLEMESLQDEVYADEISFTANAITTVTPYIESIKVTYDELTIKGRLEDLERINTINMAKLNFKSNALLAIEKYKLHDLVIDTFDTNTGVDESLTTAVYDTINKEYDGSGIVVMPIETLPASRTSLVIIPDGSATVTYAFSLDGGETWVNAGAEQIIDISAMSGNSLRIKATIPTGASLQGIAYSWA